MLPPNLSESQSLSLRTRGRRAAMAQDPRLRDRQGCRRSWSRAARSPDGRGNGHRHARILGPGAGAGASGRRARRSVRRRLRALLDAWSVIHFTTESACFLSSMPTSKSGPGRLLLWRVRPSPARSISWSFARSPSSPSTTRRTPRFHSPPSATCPERGTPTRPTSAPSAPRPPRCSVTSRLAWLAQILAR